MKAFFLLIAFIGFACANKIKFEPCVGVTSTGTISSLTVDPCAASPCAFKRGGNYTLGVTFETTVDSKKLKSIIHGIIAGAAVPFPFDKSNVCADEGCGMKCPISAKQTYTYTATLPILSEYPEIRLKVKWEMQDTDTEKDVWCFEIPVEIVSSRFAMPRSVKKLQHL